MANLHPRLYHQKVLELGFKSRRSPWSYAQDNSQSSREAKKEQKSKCVGQGVKHGLRGHKKERK